METPVCKLLEPNKTDKNCQECERVLKIILRETDYYKEYKNDEPYKDEGDSNE